MVFAELIRILTARDREVCKEGLDAARYYYILLVNVIIVLVNVFVNGILVVINVILGVIDIILVAIVQGSGKDGWLPGADQSASTAPQ